MKNVNVSSNQMSSSCVSSSLSNMILLHSGNAVFYATQKNSVHTGNRSIECYAGFPKQFHVIQLSNKDNDYIKLNEKTAILREHTLESPNGLYRYHLGFVFEKSYTFVTQPCSAGGFSCRDSDCICCSGLGYEVPYDLVSSKINIYKSCFSGNFKKIDLSFSSKDMIVKLVKKHNLIAEMRRIKSELENF